MAYLLDRMHITPDAPLTDPNANGVERALFEWAKPHGPWTQHIEPDAIPSLSFDELMASAHDAARSGDLDAWTDREAKKVLAEMRGTDGRK